MKSMLEMNALPLDHILRLERFPFRLITIFHDSEIQKNITPFSHRLLVLKYHLYEILKELISNPLQNLVARIQWNL